MSKGFEFGCLTPHDCPSAVSILRTTLGPESLSRSIYGSERVDRYLASLVSYPLWQRDHVLYGVWRSGVLVGMAHFKDIAASWHLNNIAIDPSSQGNGLGRSLVRMWFESGEKGGRRNLTLDVEENNLRALEWYMRLGFSVESRRGSYEKPLKSHSGVAEGILLVNWESAEAWQSAYGFSTFVLQCGQEGWRIGRIGEKYFRVLAEPSQMVESFLYLIDPGRRLLLESDKTPKNEDWMKCGVTLRLRKPVAEEMPI